MPSRTSLRGLCDMALQRLLHLVAVRFVRDLVHAPSRAGNEAPGNLEDLADGRFPHMGIRRPECESNRSRSSRSACSGFGSSSSAPEVAAAARGGGAGRGICAGVLSSRARSQERQSAGHDNHAGAGWPNCAAPRRTPLRAWFESLNRRYGSPSTPRCSCASAFPRDPPELRKVPFEPNRTARGSTFFALFASTSTEPSLLFLTQPLRPRRRASRWVDARKYTPCTRPYTIRWSCLSAMGSRCSGAQHSRARRGGRLSRHFPRNSRH